MLVQNALMQVTNLLKLVSDSARLIVPLKPHHILCMKSPGLLLQCFCRQILSLGALHVVENKKERLGRESLKKLNSVIMRWLRLGIVGWSEHRIPWQIMSTTIQQTFRNGAKVGRINIELAKR